MGLSFQQNFQQVSSVRGVYAQGVSNMVEKSDQPAAGCGGRCACVISCSVKRVRKNDRNREGVDRRPAPALYQAPDQTPLPSEYFY